MAKTPLLLAFICLVHSQLEKGTRVELYENVVRWFIIRKLKAFPNLLAELNIGGNYIGISTDEMTADTIKHKVTRWWNFELMKQLGYLSLTGSVNSKYQFDVDELENIHPNIIDVFTKIGLLIGDKQRSNGEQTITKYQFAHRTLQEYFAAMFIVKWENEWIRNGIESEKVKKWWMWNKNMNTFSSNELSKFINEILLAKRDSKYIESVEQYLITIKNISFDIHSNDIDDESSKQIDYINDILQKCPNIKYIRIDLHKTSVNNTIKLHLLPNIDYIEVWISNGLFSNNQSNIISISGTNQITINIRECNLSLSVLILFAEYINNNAKRFNWIRLENISIKEADMIDINKLKSIYFGQYLSTLGLDFEYGNTSIGKTYWTCINKILQKCPNIRKIQIGSLSSRISIDEPIDLQFISLKHGIELDIRNVIFTDNDSNMICIHGEVEYINIKFNDCQYSYRRLILFAKYINQNSQLFNEIQFENVFSDKNIFDAVLMNTKFDHVVIKQDGTGRYSIVKRCQI